MWLKNKALRKPITTQIQVSWVWCSVPCYSWALLCSCCSGAEAAVGPLYGGQGPLDPSVWVSHHQLAAPQLHPLDGRNQHSSSNFTRSGQRTGWRLAADSLTYSAHLQLLQGSGGHVGILEVDEGTETFMKYSDALYLPKPVTAENTELLTFSNTVWRIYRQLICYYYDYSYTQTLTPLLIVIPQ